MNIEESVFLRKASAESPIKASAKSPKSASPRKASAESPGKVSAKSPKSASPRKASAESKSRVRKNLRNFSEKVLAFNKGLIVTDRNNDTFFGITITKDRSTYETMDLPYEHRNSREDMVFVDLINNKFTFFQTKQFWEKPTVYMSEDKLEKIKYIFEQLSKFNILPDAKHLLITLDAPNSISLASSRYHQDVLPITYLTLDINKFINGLITKEERSDYTIIQYLSKSISTTIGITRNITPADRETYLKRPIEHTVRFRAINGTVLCIKNQLTLHSAPFIIQEIKDGNSFGNEFLTKKLAERRDKMDPRPLYRTQVKQLTDTQTAYLNEYITTHPDAVFTLSLTDKHIESLRKPKLKEESLETYLTHRGFEVGGGSKKTRKNRK